MSVAGPIELMMDESIYKRLHRRAKAILRNEVADHRMEPADLVHEAFLRIAKSRAPIALNDRVHFLAVATIVMRHILIDHARSANSPRRFKCVPIDSEMPLSTTPSAEALPLRHALQRLASREARLYRIVEMRFFWGFDIEEIASELSISSRTVKRHWTVARGLLRRELTEAA
jgi:RNA polymerase sigma-70 factor, ECF subfamily